MKAGVTINRPPRDAHDGVRWRSPDKQSIELLQKGAAPSPKGAMDLDAQYRRHLVSRRARVPGGAHVRLNESGSEACLAPIFPTEYAQLAAVAFGSPFGEKGARGGLLAATGKPLYMSRPPHSAVCAWSAPFV